MDKIQQNSQNQELLTAFNAAVSPVHKLWCATLLSLRHILNYFLIALAFDHLKWLGIMYEVR